MMRMFGHDIEKPMSELVAGVNVILNDFLCDQLIKISRAKVDQECRCFLGS